MRRICHSKGGAMKDIKFRAYDVQECEMFKNDSIAFIDFKNKIIRIENNHYSYFEEINEYGIILMQYTGIKDKNDTEVYEGDVIKYSSDVINSFYGVSEIIREVKFKHGTYGIEGCEKDTHIPFGNILKCKIEVIGNIYENSKLRRNIYGTSKS